MFCNAAWSIGLSADESAGELGREHAAIRRATPTSKLAPARMGNSNVILPMITVTGYLKISKIHSEDLTTQAEPRRTSDVNRESGTESANRRWLQRIVRLFRGN